VIDVIELVRVNEVNCYIYSTDLLLLELLGYVLVNIVIVAN